MQQFQHPSVNGYQMRLAMEHPSRELYALSWNVDISAQALYLAMNSFVEMGHLLKSLEFQIAYIGRSIEFQLIAERWPGSPSAFTASFEPVDPRPQAVSIEKVNMRDFKFFRIAKGGISDIVLLPEQVPEALNKILEVQATQIKEIERRKKSRENFRLYEGMLLDDIPKENDIKAQIVVFD